MCGHARYRLSTMRIRDDPGMRDEAVVRIHYHPLFFL